MFHADKTNVRINFQVFIPSPWLRFALFLLFGKILLRIFIGTLRDVEASLAVAVKALQYM